PSDRVKCSQTCSARIASTEPGEKYLAQSLGRSKFRKLISVGIQPGSNTPEAPTTIRRGRFCNDSARARALTVVVVLSRFIKGIGSRQKYHSQACGCNIMASVMRTEQLAVDDALTRMISFVRSWALKGGPPAYIRYPGLRSLPVHRAEDFSI